MPVVIVNMIALNATWFACVLGGAASLPWMGVTAAVLMVAVHLSQTPQPRLELALLVTVGLIGAVWEALMLRSGLLVYPSGLILPGLAPVWIMALWVAFAATLNVSMRWLKGRYALASLLGALGGPMGFYGGSRLGGVEFTDPAAALAALAVGWGVLMPLIVRLGERFDGWGPAYAARGAQQVTPASAD